MSATLTPRGRESTFWDIWQDLKGQEKFDTLTELYFNVIH